jgi:alkylhydroperoxidase family enzyme
VGAHARNLQLQGQDQKDVDAIAEGDPSRSQVTEKERVLLEFVKVLTLEPAKVRDTDVEALRKAGWMDEQIFEAAFDTSLFAFFNRMADAYGLDYPANGWMPQELRPARPAEPKASTNGSAPDAKPARQ